MNLPHFVRGEYFWEAELSLSSWVGYRCCGGPYGARDSDSPGSGKLTVVGEPAESGYPLDPAQERACLFLLEHDAAIHAAVTAAILEKYPEFHSIFQRPCRRKRRVHASADDRGRPEEPHRRHEHPPASL